MCSLPSPLNNAVSVEQSWAANRRAGAHPWLGTLNKSLSPLQKRTLRGLLIWSGPVWVHMGRSATYWCPKPRKDTYGTDWCPNDPQASCGLAIVTTVAAVGLSLKQGRSL